MSSHTKMICGRTSAIRSKLTRNSLQVSHHAAHSATTTSDEPSVQCANNSRTSSGAVVSTRMCENPVSCAYWTFKKWIRLRNSIAFECNDAGYLYNLAHLVKGGSVKVPWFVPTIFGILRGVGSATTIFVRSGAVDCDHLCGPGVTAQNSETGYT